MITIQQPNVIDYGDKSRLVINLNMDGIYKELWYEVDKEYKKYLCFERSDAILIGLLAYAMRSNNDITCVAPVTSELLYNINQHLLPILKKVHFSWHLPKIFTETTSNLIEKYGGVGTAISCGVDSFHSIINHLSNVNDYKPKLTHLVVSNIGNFHDPGLQNYGREKIKSNVYDRAKEVSNILNIPLIISDSNITEVIIGNGYYPYKTAFSIYAMQKLWNIYLFASSYDYTHFKFTDIIESFYYDLLSMNCFSTKQLRIYSEGGGFDRVQKTLYIADNPIVQKYLLSCFKSGSNCGLCNKCRRTMLTLYIFNKLELFKNVFPVEYFYKNIDEYLIWLKDRLLKNDPFAQEICMYILKGNCPDEIKNKIDFLDQYKNINWYNPSLQLDILNKQFISLNKQIDTMKNSLSWKITKPLRSLNHFYAENFCLIKPSTIHAKCSCILDNKTGKILYAKNKNQIVHPAGLAMLITCIIALEKGHLQDLYTISQIKDTNNIAKIVNGEIFTLIDMLYGMILLSSIHFSESIAILISGSIELFAVEMNKFANKIGLKSSYFPSPSGVKFNNEQHFSTAYDIALIMRFALNNPLFRKIISTSVYTCRTLIKEHKFENTNALIYQKIGYKDRKYEFCIGGKSGQTDNSYCFVSVSHKDLNEHILVQLGINDNYGTDQGWAYQFEDAKILHEWAFENHKKLIRKPITI